MSEQDRRTRRFPLKSDQNQSADGHNLDVEFSDEMADQEDWEALERSERADRRQNGQLRL